MTPFVVYIDERGAAVQWTHTAPLHRFIGHGTNAYALRVAGKVTTTPMLFICDEGASLLDDLELK